MKCPILLSHISSGQHGALEAGDQLQLCCCVCMCVNVLLLPSPCAEESFTLCRLAFRGCGFEGVRIAVTHEAGYGMQERVDAVSICKQKEQKVCSVSPGMGRFIRRQNKTDYILLRREKRMYYFWMKIN